MSLWSPFKEEYNEIPDSVIVEYVLPLLDISIKQAIELLEQNGYVVKRKTNDKS